MIVFYWAFGVLGILAGLYAILLGLVGRMPRFVGSARAVGQAVGMHIQGRMALLVAGLLFIIVGWIMMLEGWNSAFGPKQPELDQWNRGIEFVNRSQWDEAIKCFTKALEINPNYSPARVWRGECYTKKSMWSEAINDYEASLQSQQRMIPSWFNLGRCYYNSGNYPKALETWTQYVDKYRNMKDFDPVVWSNRAMAFAHVGKPKEAIEDITRAVEAKVAKPREWRYRAVCYVALGDLDKAQADAAKAVELDPDECMSHLRLGWVLMCRSEHARAADTLKKAVSLPAKDAPNHGQACLLLWVATARTSGPAKANAAVTAAQVKDDKWASTLFSVLTGKVSPEVAMKEASAKPSEEDRRDCQRDVHYYHGQRLLIAGQAAAAEAEFRQCVEDTTDALAFVRWLAKAELPRP